MNTMQNDTGKTEFLPFSRPDISEEDIAAVGQVLRSGWITTGPQAAEFEDRFCRYTGAQGAAAVCSATAGMHILLHALGIGPGDEVITPAMTWVSTVNLIAMAGARPVFADIDRDTLMVTPESIEACLSSRTRMIIPVHFAGAAADMDPIRTFARDNDLLLVEDAAHAMGTEYKGEKIGSQGTAVFSFHPIKNLTTGEGGMICCDDPDLLVRLRRLKFHGLGMDAHDRNMQGRSPQAQVIEPGYKYNLTDISAILGIRQLERLAEFNRKRKNLAALYLEQLSGIEEILPLSIPSYDMTHAWHLFVVRLDTDRAGISRNEFMDKLKQQNIGTGIHFMAVHLQKFYRETMGFKPGLLPATEWNSERICSLPLFPGMNPEDVTRVVSAIKEVLK
jgi:UDP-4-amino-4-deoxy-L-arabinose-oxoglutarate aminotransferase